MIVTTANVIPGTTELAAILKQEFSGSYSYNLFGLGSEKSIMVHKSVFAGVQITRDDHAVTIQGTPPSLAAAYFLAFLELTGLAVFFGFPLRKSYAELEREVGTFIYHKYNS